MIESELLQIGLNYGFPALMCIYFVFKVEKVVNNNTEVIEAFLVETVKCRNKKK